MWNMLWLCAVFFVSVLLPVSNAYSLIRLSLYRTLVAETAVKKERTQLQLCVEWFGLKPYKLSMYFLSAQLHKIEEPHCYGLADGQTGTPGRIIVVTAICLTDDLRNLFGFVSGWLNSTVIFSFCLFDHRKWIYQNLSKEAVNCHVYLIIIQYVSTLVLIRWVYDSILPFVMQLLV